MWFLDKWAFEASLPSALAFVVPLLSLFGGSCLSGGCVKVSKGKKGLSLKLLKSTIEENKMIGEFVIPLTVIWDQGQTWKICWYLNLGVANVGNGSL